MAAETKLTITYETDEKPDTVSVHPIALYNVDDPEGRPKVNTQSATSTTSGRAVDSDTDNDDDPA